MHDEEEVPELQFIGSAEDMDLDDLADEIEDEPWLENPIMGAEELLRFSRARHLLAQR